MAKPADRPAARFPVPVQNEKSEEPAPLSAESLHQILRQIVGIRVNASRQANWPALPNWGATLEERAVLLIHGGGKHGRIRETSKTPSGSQSYAGHPNLTASEESRALVFVGSCRANASRGTVRHLLACGERSDCEAIRVRGARMRGADFVKTGRVLSNRTAC